MSLINYILDKPGICIQIKKEKSEFVYLKKICLAFKEKRGWITEREMLGVIAEIYSNDLLTLKQKRYLWKNFLHREETLEDKKMFWKLTEREQIVEMSKEIQVLF